MKIGDYFGLPKKEGEVGIEIEIEAARTPKFTAGGWTTIGDGSLRGADPAEYILTDPVPRDQVGHFLDYWHRRVFKGDNYIIGLVDPCPRAGVHVHLNVQQFTFKQLMSLYCLHGIFEDLFVNYCGEDRSGNLFCLRNCDAEGLIDFVRNAAKAGRWKDLASDTIRYSAMNLCAVPKFGSVEFRAMRGTTDINLISTWINMLLKLKDASLQFKQPSDIIGSFSVAGPEVFLRDIMGDYSELLQAEGMSQSIKEGMRRMQMVAYGKIVEPKVPRKKIERVDMGLVVPAGGRWGEANGNVGGVNPLRIQPYRNRARAGNELLIDPAAIGDNDNRPTGVFNPDFPSPNQEGRVLIRDDNDWFYWVNQNLERALNGFRVYWLVDLREEEQEDIDEVDFFDEEAHERNP